MRPSKCPRCHADIGIVRSTRSRQLIVLDPHPAAEGTVRLSLDGETAEVLTPEFADAAQKDGELLYVGHYEHCGRPKVASYLTDAERNRQRLKPGAHDLGGEA